MALAIIIFLLLIIALSTELGQIIFGGVLGFLIKYLVSEYDRGIKIINIASKILKRAGQIAKSLLVPAGIVVLVWAVYMRSSKDYYEFGLLLVLGVALTILLKGVNWLSNKLKVDEGRLLSFIIVLGLVPFLIFLMIVLDSLGMSPG